MEVDKIIDVRRCQYASGFYQMLQWLEAEVGAPIGENMQDGEGPEFTYTQSGTGWKYVFHRTGTEPSPEMLPFYKVTTKTHYNKSRKDNSNISDSIPIDKLYMANFVVFDELTDAIKARLTYFSA